MARNKHPEVTVERILDAAQQLFLQKGYENTTIQDIVNELGGLTKGAIYHHFRSKEEIMDAVGDRMFLENNPFEAVKGRADLNGLQKFREAVRLNQADTARVQITQQSLPVPLSPRLLVDMVRSNCTVLTPYYEQLIEEGNRDGSMHTEYAREIAELLPLMSSVWMMPSIFPASRQALRRKFCFMRDMLAAMGVPMVDDSIMALVDEFLAGVSGLEESDEPQPAPEKAAGQRQGESAGARPGETFEPKPEETAGPHRG